MPGELPAARVTDQTAHLAVPAAPGTGAPTVLIEGLPAWRTMVDTHACAVPTPAPHGPEKIYLGSTTVLINEQMACRMGDILQGMGPPNLVMMGSETVIIGDVGFGIAKLGFQEAFAAASRGLLGEWNNLTPAERLARLQDGLNAALPVGMPSLTLQENASLDPRTRGQFSFRKWSVLLNPNVLSDSMDVKAMGRLVNTAYHEGRHGQQWWNAAQYLAGTGKSAGHIEGVMQIPKDVADAAVGHPASSGTSEGALGEGVYTSVYGARGAYRNQVLGSLSDPRAYDQYRALPEEEDAWRQGDDVEQEFLGMR